MSETPADFVGLAEIEKHFGIPKHRTIRFMRRGLFAAPIAPLKAGHVFRTSDVRKAVTKLRNGGHL